MIAKPAPDDLDRPESVAVVGLTPTGLPFAVSLADRGFKVIAVESIGSILKQVKDGISPYREPHLQELLNKVIESDTFYAVPSMTALVDVPPVIILFTETPPDNKIGMIDHGMLTSALQKVADRLADTPKDAYHTIVISSTVMPGYCKHMLSDIVKRSGKIPGGNLGLCYIPSNVRAGRAIRDTEAPGYVVIGRSSTEASDRVLPIYISESNPDIYITNLVNAEISKLSVSCLFGLKVALANELSLLCERIPEADIDAVTAVLGLDGDVGPGYLTAGAPFGGATLPRDIITIQAVARAANANLPLAGNILSSNEATAARILNIVTTEIIKSKNSRVAILGLAYKPDSTLKTGSLGSILARNLKALNVTFRTYDPFAVDKDSVKNAQAAINGAGIIVIAGNDPAFRDLKYKKDQLVIDVWRALDGDIVRNTGARYLGLGLGE